MNSDQGEGHPQQEHGPPQQPGFAPQFIPVHPNNPFYNNLPRSNLAEIERHNPTSGGTDGRGSFNRGSRGRRGTRDVSYYRKTPRYCFPERPDYKPDYGPVKFVPSGEGDKPEPPPADEADEIQISGVSSIVQPDIEFQITDVIMAPLASECIPGIISFPEEAKQELTMTDAATFTMISKKRGFDSAGQCK